MRKMLRKWPESPRPSLRYAMLERSAWEASLGLGDTLLSFRSQEINSQLRVHLSGSYHIIGTYLLVHGVHIAFFTWPEADSWDARDAGGVCPIG